MNQRLIGLGAGTLSGCESSARGGNEWPCRAAARGMQHLDIRRLRCAAARTAHDQRTRICGCHRRRLRPPGHTRRVRSGRLGVHQQQGQPGQRRVLQHQVRLPVLQPARRRGGRHRLHRPESRQQRRRPRRRDRLQGLEKSIGVEFDNWNNGGIDGFSDNHAGIDINGDVNSVARSPLAPINLDDPSVVHHAWVDYNGATNALEVRVADSNTRPAAALLTHTVDLPPSWAGPVRRPTTRSSGSPRAQEPRRPTTTSCPGSSATATGPSARTARPSSTPGAPTPVRKAHRWASPAPRRTT